MGWLDLGGSEIREPRFYNSSEVDENWSHEQVLYFLSFDFLIDSSSLSSFQAFLSTWEFIPEKTRNKDAKNMMSNLP